MVSCKRNCWVFLVTKENRSKTQHTPKRPRQTDKNEEFTIKLCNFYAVSLDSSLN